MKIKISENFRITSSSTEFKLENLKTVTKKGENFGKKTWVTAGHYGSLESLLKCVPDKVAKSSEVETLAELVKEMKKYREIIEKGFE